MPVIQLISYPPHICQSGYKLFRDSKTQIWRWLLTTIEAPQKDLLEGWSMWKIKWEKFRSICIDGWIRVKICIKIDQHNNFLVKVFSLLNLPYYQGDQIGPIFSYWVLITLGRFRQK
jgi:hypothetical protein